MAASVSQRTRMRSLFRQITKLIDTERKDVVEVINVLEALKEGQRIWIGPSGPKAELSIQATKAALAVEISGLEFGVRTRHCLQTLNVQTLRDLALKTHTDISLTRHSGESTLREIKQMLAVYGLHLGMLESQLPKIEEQDEEPGQSANS